MNNPKFLILADRITSEQREQLHRVVKENANGWWHHFTNVWIVGGHDVVFWRDLISDIISSPAAVLVMKVPDEVGINWAYRGPDAEKRAEWLHSHM